VTTDPPQRRYGTGLYDTTGIYAEYVPPVLPPPEPPVDEFANIDPDPAGPAPRVAYRFLTFDYVTGKFLGELVPSSFEVERILSGAGAAKVTVGLPHETEAARSLLTISQPRRCGLYVERDGLAVWSGMIWSRAWDNRDADTVVLSGAEDWSYLRRRYVKDLLSWTAGPLDDQLAIARDLVRYAQGQTLETKGLAYAQARNANVGILLGTETSGIKREVAYKGHVAPKEVAEAIEQLSDNANGFDFAIEVARSNAGSVARTLRLWHPKRTRSASLTGWRAELGANVLSVSVPDDVGATATTVIGSNDLGQDKTLRAYATAQYLLDSGYPVLEESLTARNVKEQATLQQKVNEALSQFVAGDGIADVDLDPTSDLLPIERVELGDDVEVVVPRRSVYDDGVLTARFPDGLRQTRRIVAWKLGGNARGERFSVRFEEAEDPSIEVGDGAGRTT
jgi:hypothetical protein